MMSTGLTNLLYLFFGANFCTKTVKDCYLEHIVLAGTEDTFSLGTQTGQLFRCGKTRLNTQN